MILLAAFVLGAVLQAALLVPLWAADRRRDAARVNGLLTLLESKAAPAEFAAYLDPPKIVPTPGWLFSEDGLVSVPLDDEDA